MLKEVTNLVNDIVLSSVETDDIIGLNNIRNVKHWFIIDEIKPNVIAMLHDEGILPTLIITSGCIFAGSEHHFGATKNAKRIEERIETGLAAA